MKTIQLYTKENQYGLNVIHSISDNAITNFKRFAPKVIEQSLKTPALGFVDFLAETHSIMIKQENETKNNRLSFLFKYCVLSFLSFYI
jgi:hypothetical protein